MQTYRSQTRWSKTDASPTSSPSYQKPTHKRIYTPLPAGGTAAAKPPHECPLRRRSAPSPGHAKSCRSGGHSGTPAQASDLSPELERLDRAVDDLPGGELVPRDRVD